MSYSLTKNFINLYNKKYDEIHMLNNEQIEKLYEKVESLDNKEENNYYINDFKKLKDKLEDNYHTKSNKNMEYFVKNYLTKMNTKTGEITDYKYHNNSFRYLSYFIKDEKNNKLVFDEVKKGEYLQNQDKIYAYKKIAKVRYLDYVNKNKEKVFITFTLPNKKFHKYDKNGNLTKTYENTESFEENILSGFIKISEIHHYFYQTLKFKIKRYCKKQNIKNDDKKVIDFIKILEPHKNLYPHLHSLFYVDKEFLPIILEVYEMTVKNFKLKQTKFEVLKQIKGSSYLTKYLLKTVKTKGNKDTNIYNYYKRYFSKFRFFTSSNYRYTNQEKLDLVYKYLYNNKKTLLERYKKSEKPLYFLLEKLITKKIFTFEEENKQTFTINFDKIKKEYKQTLKKYKEDKKLEENTKTTDNIGLIFDKDCGMYIDITSDKLEDLYFTYEHLEKEYNKISEFNYIKKFKQSIMFNLSNYIKTVNTKKVVKMYYKDKLVLDKNNFTYIKLLENDIKELLKNPFEN